jgi:hypothetical protein
MDVSLTLRDKCRLRVFMNRMLRRISELMREEVTDSQKMHNEELCNFCPSPNITKMIRSIRVLASAIHILKIGKMIKSSMRLAGHVAHMGEKRNSSGVLVGLLVGKRRRARHT